MNSINFSLGGRFMFEAVKPNGERRLLCDWFDNMIVDQGLNRIGQGGAPFNSCMVGTSATVAGAAQTALLARVATTTDLQSYLDGVNIPGGYAYRRSTFRFAAGAAAGNLSEVGVGYNTTDVFSRALIADGNGSPTTITVLSDEFLDVTYEFRIYWPVADVTGTVSISGSSYSTTLRPAMISNWSSVFTFLMANGSNVNPASLGGLRAYGAGALGDNTVNPGGTDLGAATSVVIGAYSNNSYARTYTVTWGLSPVTASISNFTCYTVMGLFKGSFSPAIPKTASNVFSLDFRVTWSRTESTAGVNPAIGNLYVLSGRVASSGTVALTSRVEFRTDGSIYETESLQSGGSQTVKVGEWYQPLTAAIGTAYKVKLTQVTNTGGTLTGNMVGSFYTMTADAFVQLSHSSAGQYNFSASFTYEIQVAAGGPVLSTGTVNLEVAREF